MAGIVRIGKRRWLAGLSWCSFEDAPSRDELQQDAQRLGASWSCVRNTDTAIQAGFCAPLDDVERPAGLYSLAAKLAATHEQPWSATFQLDDGVWWYIAVRDGNAIMPDGDVLGSDQLIVEVRERHAIYSDWNHIEGDASSLAALIQEADARPIPVRSLSRGELPVNPLLVLSALFLLACGGYYWWIQQQVEMQAQAEAMAKMRAQLSATPAVLPPSSPLLTIPQPNDWLAACGDVVLSLPLSQSGWMLDSTSCNGDAATAIWTRKDGATVATKPDGTLSEEGEAIEQVIPLDIASLRGVDDAIVFEDAQRQLRAWAQAANFAVVIDKPTSAVSLPGAITVSAEAAMPQANVQIEVFISPFDLDLTSIPGLRLTGLKSNGNNGWSMRGILYGH